MSLIQSCDTFWRNRWIISHVLDVFSRKRVEIEAFLGIQLNILIQPSGHPRLIPSLPFFLHVLEISLQFCQIDKFKGERNLVLVTQTRDNSIMTCMWLWSILAVVHPPPWSPIIIIIRAASPSSCGLGFHNPASAVIFSPSRQHSIASSSSWLLPLSLRLCFTAIRPFCDRAAGSSKEVNYFVWFSIFEVWEGSYLWQSGSWDQVRRLQQLPPKHGELLHRPSSLLSWMHELCKLPISMHCRQKPAAPRSTLSVGLVMKFTTLLKWPLCGHSAN